MTEITEVTLFEGINADLMGLDKPLQEWFVVNEPGSSPESQLHVRSLPCAQPASPTGTPATTAPALPYCEVEQKDFTRV